ETDRYDPGWPPSGDPEISGDPTTDDGPDHFPEMMEGIGLLAQTIPEVRIPVAELSDVLDALVDRYDREDVEEEEDEGDSEEDGNDDSGKGNRK
ncbi:MAG: hypothetical protein Q4C47_10060, partial [Planctomycetia bacterium]|nr:hypothetical protein [Planctomycetia bacterium]